MSIAIFCAAIFLAANSGALADDDPERGMGVCQFIARHTADELWITPSTAFPRQKSVFLSDYFVRFGWFDLDGDGIPEHVTRYEFNGTMGGDSYEYKLSSMPKDSNNPYDVLPDAVSDYLNENRFSFGEAFLPFKGHIFDVEFSDEAGAFPVQATYVTPDGKSHIACAFEGVAKVFNWSYPQLGAFAATILKGWPKVDVDSWMGLAMPASGRLPDKAPASSYKTEMVGGAFFPECQNAEDSCSDIWTADFDNDGTADRLLLMSGGSGAGRGCDASYFILLTPQNQIATGRKQELLLRLQGVDLKDAYPVRPCGLEFRWVRVSGKILLERRSARQPLKLTTQLAHDFRMAHDGKIDIIATAMFQVTPKILYDAAPK